MKLGIQNSKLGVLVSVLVFGYSITLTADPIRAATPTRRKDILFQIHHYANLRRVEQGAIDLCFLGDSITMRWDKQVWQKHYSTRNAANFGIDGDRTEHVLWRINNGEIDGISPKVVVLLIGINNVSRDPPADIAKGIKAIVSTLRERLPRSKILLLGIFPVGPVSNQYRDQVRLVNADIAKLDDGQMIRFLDLGKSFLESDRTISNEIMPDYLHLSRKGYEIWAKTMEPLLSEMLGEKKAGVKSET